MNNSKIIRKAWEGYDDSKAIRFIENISPGLSTNYVYRITFDDGDMVIAKVSGFGKYEYFKEDHRIIHSLANNLLYPFDNLLAKSLLKNNRVYVYHYVGERTDAWVVFYNPVRMLSRLPELLDDNDILKLGEQIGKFHAACSRVKNVLPKSLKTLYTDIADLQRQLELKKQQFGTKAQVDLLKYHCDQFLENSLKLNATSFGSIPVFLDWTTDNFSVGPELELYSRWDYDWFRLGPRILDFYFLSKIVAYKDESKYLSFDITTLTDDRFIIFLKAYHKINPLNIDEIRFMKEGYRFFILNYVIRYGKDIFKRPYGQKLRREALEQYLPSVDIVFDADKIIRWLGLK